MGIWNYFLFNGINRRTGQPIAPLLEATPSLTSTLWAPSGINLNDLTKTGWGIVTSTQDPDAARIRDALSPLIEKRRVESEDCVAFLDYVSGMDVYTFRLRHRDLFHRMNRKTAPYYLLLAGSPKYIPFPFQSELSASHSVGRLHFKDIEQYSHYASSARLAEKEQNRPNRAVFWAADHPDDEGSLCTTENLTQPLVEEILKNDNGFRIEPFLSRAATKKSLTDSLGRGAPSFLFTSGHGLFFPSGDEDQQEEQGALICSDWEGPASGPPDEKHFFAANDFDAANSPRGLISFHFACNSAGTPQYDNYYFQQNADVQAETAPEPFVSALAQKMLGPSGGGSLAFIGHVERTWLNTFLWRQINDKPLIYSEVIQAILRGNRIGYALEIFAKVCAEISATVIQAAIETPGDYDLKKRAASMLSQINDLRGFVVIGDPAVRIHRVNSEDSKENR